MMKSYYKNKNLTLKKHRIFVFFIINKINEYSLNTPIYILCPSSYKNM